ncbi:MAG: hypothetical protein LAO78_27400 [Acidobacteriia bacterium]|nr:hypothetical protein [Terriglobia bacterium]
MKKRGLIIAGVVVLLGAWLMVIGYEFLEKENALFQKKVKAAREEAQRCEARNSKYRNFDQFRTSIRMPYTSDLPAERWMHQFSTLHAGMSEAEVEIVMGAPDYARCVVNKEGDKFVGSNWNYEVVIPQELAANGQNSEIEIFFGPDGKLTDKSAVNMQPKPSPTPAAVATPMPESSPSPAASPTMTATPGVSPSPQAIPSATATPSPTP